MEIDIAEVGLIPGYRVVKYPFVKEDFSMATEEGCETRKSWRPGVLFRSSGRYGEDVEACANAEGHMMLTVVGVFKPDKFPTRVFYTRQWADPDGHVFGKKKLHICTLEKFRRISANYQHPYEIVASLNTQEEMG